MIILYVYVMINDDTQDKMKTLNHRNHWSCWFTPYYVLRSRFCFFHLLPFYIDGYHLMSSSRLYTTNELFTFTRDKYSNVI